MIRLMLSAFQSIIPSQLNVSQLMSPSENFLKDALYCCADLVGTMCPRETLLEFWASALVAPRLACPSENPRSVLYTKFRIPKK